MVKTVQIYGGIGPSRGSVTFSNVVSQLAEKDRYPEVEVRINSPGGNPSEAIAMFHELRRRADKVTTVCEGMAYSAASLLFMCGDDRQMNRGSMFMVHSPLMEMSGNAREMAKGSELLTKMENQFTEIYAIRSGQSVHAVSAMMAEETYLTAEEAVEKGFATAVIDSYAMAAHVDVSQFPNVKLPTLYGSSPWADGEYERTLRQRSQRTPREHAEAMQQCRTVNMKADHKKATNWLLQNLGN